MRLLVSLSAAVALLLITGCAEWEPNEAEAVYLVESYYLFSRGGKEVDAEILSRGKYIRKCKCYPVKFKVFFSSDNKFIKTFYFFKNEAGNVEIRDHLPH